MRGPWQEKSAIAAILCETGTRLGRFWRVALVIAAVLIGSQAQAVPPGYWPNGAEGAVSLTFDDGMPSQLDHAVPVLDRWGLKATFYVTPTYALDWDKNIERWRQLARDGHEIGNHTDRHPCSCQNNFRKGDSYCLEKLDKSEVLRAIDDAEKQIALLTREPPAARSFAYPCYDTDVGAGINRRSYVPDVAQRYSAARAGQGADNDPETVDLFYIRAFAAENVTASEVIARIEASVRQGHWMVLVFHGIGKEWDVIDPVEFDRILEYLGRNKKRIWVAPLIDVAGYVRARQAGGTPK